MQDYIVEFFTYFGCPLQWNEQTLDVELTPELAQHFAKTSLRLVFQPEHLSEETDLVTYGSYITSRIYDILKERGQRVAIALPKKYNLKNFPDEHEIFFYHARRTRRRIREVKRTETYLTFRIIYYSNERIEELVTVGMDSQGRILYDIDFPYSSESLAEAEFCRFPYTRQEASVMYSNCQDSVKRYAEKKALHYQTQLAEHYHHDVLRLEGYYRQMIEEVPDLTLNREEQIRRLQQEYGVKIAEELKKCQIQVAIEPVNFCTVTIPFQRLRSSVVPQHSRQHQQEISVDLYQNLFSGAIIYPRCTSCHREMRHVGICEGQSHAVCRDCLVTCSRCGKDMCRECGIERCAVCGAWVCADCCETCELCGKRVCHEHLLGCVSCRHHFCQDCGVTCEECGNVVGKIHIFTCDISGKAICYDCLVTCPCCDQQVSQSQAHICGFCGQNMCAECSFRCAVCGDIFCVHHIRECELTGEMVCPQHRGVCSTCSRQVSTDKLHVCDECGAPVCVECALQCHECGIFFCREHREEIVTCPTCKQTYCHLCYSGQGVCAECRNEERAT